MQSAINTLREHALFALDMAKLFRNNAGTSLEPYKSNWTESSKAQLQIAKEFLSAARIIEKTIKQ